jgi:hypothetical protein
MKTTYSSKYNEKPESGGSSILLNSSISAPILPMSSSTIEATDDIHKNIRFIKERLKALIQISSLDEATMAEGGWTQEDVREELLKLHNELSSERMKVHIISEKSGNSKRISPLSTNKYHPFSSTTSTTSTTSATREHLFSDEVAIKLQILTKKLNYIVKNNEKEIRISKFGEALKKKSPDNGTVGHLIPLSLHPTNNNVLKPLFRGDKSPTGLRRQRRRARHSIGLRHKHQ